MDWRRALRHILQWLLGILEDDALPRVEEEYQRRRKMLREDVLGLIESNGGPRGLDLSNTDLSSIDLSGEYLAGVNLAGSSLRNARLARSNLSDACLVGATCADADFSQVNLAGADLANAYFRAADLTGAFLYRAVLDGTDFHDATLKQASLYRASLEGTRLSKEILGNGIVQDSEHDFDAYLKHFWPEPVYKERVDRYLGRRLLEAEEVYRSLKQLFMDQGRYSDSSWAYVRERQSRRQTHHPKRSRQYYQDEITCSGQRQVWSTLLFYLKHVAMWYWDWASELSSGYGERPLRTVVWAAVTVVLFPLLFWLTGGIVSNAGAMTWLDYLNYSFGAFTTMGFAEFQATTPLAQTLTSIEALLGISWLALLMFALGNRISRS